VGAPGQGARMCGDELTLTLKDVQHESDVARVREKVLPAIGQPYELRRNTVPISVSAGIAFSPSDASASAQLLRPADLAMYASTEQVRNRFLRFEPAMLREEQWRRPPSHTLGNGVGSAQVNASGAKDALGMRTVPMSTVEMCNTVIQTRATLDNQRLLVSASNVLPYQKTSPNDALAQFLAPGTADGAARLVAVRAALKSLGSASDAAAVLRLTTGVDEALQQAVLGWLKVRYPDAFK